jgi:CheY-specific phosphatase CheX
MIMAGTSFPGVECVGQATVATFQQTCGVTVVPIDAAAAQERPGEMLLSVISLVGDVAWSVMLSLPKAVAIGMAEKFAGFAIGDDRPTISDAVGELTNILVAGVQTRLDEKGLRGNISLPSMMWCNNMQPVGRQMVESCFLHFESPWGRFTVMVSAANRIVRAGSLGLGSQRPGLRQPATGLQPQPDGEVIQKLTDLSRGMGERLSLGAISREDLRVLRDELAGITTSEMAAVHLEVAGQLLTAALFEQQDQAQRKLKLATEALSLALADLHGRCGRGANR